MWTDGRGSMSKAKERIRNLNSRLRSETGSPVGDDTCGRQLSCQPAVLEPTDTSAMFPPRGLTRSTARPLLTGVQEHYVKSSEWCLGDSLTDRLWLYKADVEKGSCSDGTLGRYPEPEPEPVRPKPAFPNAKMHAADFRAHARGMHNVRHPPQGNASADLAEGLEDWEPPKEEINAPSVCKSAEARRTEKVTYGMLQAELVGFLQEVLQSDQDKPELSEITPQRQQQLDRLKAAMPRTQKPAPNRRWKPPDLSKAPKWIVRQPKLPEPEPVPAPLPDAPSEEDVVQVVLGVGNSSFVHSMEYYPKEGKVRISLDSGRKFWFHDVQDDFMEAFRTKMAAENGQGRLQMFTTSAEEDSEYGRP